VKLCVPVDKSDDQLGGNIINSHWYRGWRRIGFRSASLEGEVLEWDALGSSRRPERSYSAQSNEIAEEGSMSFLACLLESSLNAPKIVGLYSETS
jgi:hypothetical protein